MAGQGYREWVTGEQLTDVNMQQYLQDQAVMVFVDAAARTTALTGYISEGMVTYLASTQALQVYDGAAWVAVTPDVADATPTVAGVIYGSTPTNSTYPYIFGRNSLTNDANGGGYLYGSIGVGSYALAANTTGYGNVAVGHTASQANVTGAGNTSVGLAAGRDGIGSDNVMVGHSAGALNQAATVTNQNTFVGSGAGQTGFTNFTGSNNVCLGYAAIPSATAVSNQITLGNSSITVLRSQVTSITALSDKRDKTNIQPLTEGLEFINKLKPVRFDWDTRDKAKVGIKDFGFIAQDLVAVEDQGENHDWLQLTLRDNPEKLEATQGRLIPILVKAVQDLSAKVEELETRLDAK